MDLLHDPEEKIQCPYNPSHHIMRKKMNGHLIKCKASYPDTKLVECDFNVNHKVAEPELQYHHENCPDRRKIEHIVYQEEGAVTNRFPVHNIDVEAEESWDNFNATSYDPKKYCESQPVLRHIDVVSASQRKNFRMEERHRLNEISNNRPTPAAQVERPVASSSSGVSKRNLPEKPTSTVKETTPDAVAEIVERLKLGKNKVFVPKQN